MQDTTLTNLIQLSRRNALKGMAGLVTMAGIGGVATGLRAAQGGTIVWGKPLEATLYDPHTSILASSWELLHQIYDGLTDLDAEMNPVPCLAESWTQPDDLTYIFKLRPGIKFSNGRDVTADDVVGSLLRLRDPKTGSFFREQMGKITAVTAQGADGVTITLEEPYAPLLSALASTMASILPMQELAAGSYDPNKDMLGTGPFMVTSHTQGDNWVLDRNPHYWQAGLPKVDQLVVRIIPSDQGLVAALRDGTIDIASFNASPDAPLLLQNVENLKIVQNPVSNLFLMVLNAVSPKSPFQNEKLRQAVALTLDREKLRDIALGGNADVTSVMPPLFGACDTTKLPFFNRDVEKAKALLEEGGVSGLTFELLITPEPVWQMMGQIIKESLAEIGLTANLATVDEGVATKRLWIDNPGDFDASITWYAGYSDPAMLPLWWDPGVAGFTAGYTPSDPTLNELIASTRRLALNDPSRPEALQALCAAIDQTANVIPLLTRRDTVAYRTDRINAELAHKDGYANTVRGMEGFEKL